MREYPNKVPDRPMFGILKFPLAFTALRYWSTKCPTEHDWLNADCEDEARSASVEEGGQGIPSAFGDEGIAKLYHPHDEAMDDRVHVPWGAL